VVDIGFCSLGVAPLGVSQAVTVAVAGQQMDMIRQTIEKVKFSFIMANFYGSLLVR
jgi:hypothetical protein